MPAPKAFLTGIVGQDGSYLAEQLLAEGYEVHGLVHPETTPPVTPMDPYKKDPGRYPLHFHEGNLADSSRLHKLLGDLKPDEVYNLAAVSDDQVSMKEPVLTAEINALGPVRLLEAIQRFCPKAKFLQASSAQLFGQADVSPQNESTPFKPQSPYGYAKAFAHWMTVYYREHHNLFTCNAILYNHESPRRGEAFVTRKISMSVARIKAGKQKELVLGNLDMVRDWTFAGDTVRAMHLALKADKPGDYVIGSGEEHTVREFVVEAFSYAGLDWKKYVKFDDSFVRTVDIGKMKADPSHARKVLGWKPQVDFKGLVHLMVDADFQCEGLKPTHS